MTQDAWINFTIEFVKNKHQYQLRKYTTNVYYYTHCIEVMNIVSKSPTCTYNMKIAALLHDTLEDTQTTVEELESVFGKTVTQYVIGLTQISKSSDGNRKVRKQKDLEFYASQNPEVQTIKVADLISNAQDILSKDPDKFGPVFIAEAKDLYTALDKACPMLRSSLYAVLNP